jgi:hypothetical protein
MPGDTLEMRDKVLYLNGRPMVEPFAGTRTASPIPPTRACSGSASTWWMGAGPSRYRRPATPGARWWCRAASSSPWATTATTPRIPATGASSTKADIRGRPIFVYYSFTRDPLQPFSWLTDVRWSRIGELIR